MGHPYMILLVMLCQTLVYKEVTALFQLSSRKPKPIIYAATLILTSADVADGDGDSKSQGGFAKRERWNKTLNWYANTLSVMDK